MIKNKGKIALDYNIRESKLVGNMHGSLCEYGTFSTFQIIF